MQYFMHKEGGHVATFDDGEKPSLIKPEDWIPVHLHPGPGAMHAEPKLWAKVVAVTAALLAVAGFLALLGAGVVAAWNAVL